MSNRRGDTDLPAPIDAGVGVGVELSFDEVVIIAGTLFQPQRKVEQRTMETGLLERPAARVFKHSGTWVKILAATMTESHQPGLVVNGGFPPS